ncbi:GNAT family N-acetyltransferase [Streptococcus sp. E29BA]|uniref:GNAT family N-acetyltransferase n=1 Tax=Streptococcus sp. E29BA TaxID=3278716 RepID=UPI00359F0C1A
MGSNSYSYQQLEWDTNFFGVSSGRIVLHDALGMREYSKILADLDSNEFTVIYNEGNIPVLNEWLGQNTVASLMDVNVQFSKKRSAFSQKGSNQVTIKNNLTPSEDILDIASRSFIYSRFFNDSKLEKSKACMVYRNWVRTAFEREEKYFAQFMNETVCLGFLLFSIHNDELIIELIAVDSSVKQQGIGSSLLDSVEQFAFQEKVNTIKVGTQINNSKAIRFYTKNGYLYQSCSSVYHHWRN